MMGTLTVDTSELDRLIASISAKEIEEIPKGKFRQGVTALNKEIVTTAPVDTGYYRAGWRLEFNPDGKEAVISNPVNYAEWLIFGTRRFKFVRNWTHLARADISRGILHDVRAIFFEWKERFLKDMGAK